ncbi:hypothetical protein DHEL01_v209377 [Diaporthe helianthi]|uniref:Uncharacterized protein n=1 Tax=Diaporthe helianthi TaxID=158607 RepID=A0A2P5HPP6_DIAHE|nr:hypothetical protein DHEL01_v209377 [Diaporthe helianthi]
MRSNQGTSHRANSESSENRTNSSSSRENSASSEPARDRTNSSGSRETSASSEPEGDHWPLFTKKITPRRWIPIKSEYRLYGCDFADISFRCELYCELENPGASEDQLLDTARSFMLKCPAALASLEDMCEEAAMFSYRRYRSTHPRPRDPSGLDGKRHDRDTSVFSDDLERDRQEQGFGRPLRAAAEDWKDITLVRDADKNEPGEVRGKIQMIIGKWIDPDLDSDSSDEEFPAIDSEEFKKVHHRWCETRGYSTHDYLITIRQLERYRSARRPGTALDLRGCQCGAADKANHESGSADRITDIS